MKTILAAALGVTLLASAQAAPPRPGEPAPDFTARTASGETVRLSDFAGEKVVLEWTNADCPFVQKHYGSGNMQALQNRVTADGTVWLSVVSSAPGKQGHVTGAQAQTLTADRKAAPTHVVLDASGEVGRLYGAKTTPHMYVVDEEGTLRYAGAIDTIRSTDKADVARADNYVTAAMRALREGRAVAVPQSQPYGCSVKYAD